MTCACHSIDAKECIRSRYNVYLMDEDEAADWEDDRCECACHYEWQDDSECMEFA